tara:strand:+ start:217 stop:753 length:537 start_codon:yes stop_codon:yes gene_type:complete
MKNKIIIAIFGLLILGGCAGTKPASQKDVPDWYLNPPKYENKFVGVGDALKPQLSLAKSVATTRARAEVSKAMKETVSSIVNSYLQASGMGADASAVEFTEDVTKSVSSNTLSGCVIDRTEIIDGRVFVMVTYDVNEARIQTKNAMRNSAKKDEALYNEFKARQGFDALDKEIDLMGE